MLRAFDFPSFLISYKMQYLNLGFGLGNDWDFVEFLMNLERT